jgi:DNA-binding GntR family transcriptional regulator
MSSRERATDQVDPAELFHTLVSPDATLADRAYFELRDRIVTLKLAPGALIRDEDIMEELQMSRTPIREALLRLSLQGLVDVVPRRGAFVSDVNAGNVGAIYELRRELEVIAAGWAAERRSAADVREIDTLLETIHEETRLPQEPDWDPRSQLPLDKMSHFLIYRMSGNACLEEVMQSYFFLSVRIWFLASERARFESPFATMVDLLQAIKARDAAAARSSALRHTREAEDAIRQAL